MNKLFKKSLALLLSVMMLAGMVPLTSGTALAAGGKIDMSTVFSSWVNYPANLYKDAGETVPGAFNAGWQYDSTEGALRTTQNVGWTGFYNPDGFGMSVGTFEYQMKETAGHADPQGWTWGMTMSGSGLDTAYSYYVFEECNCGHWTIAYIEDYKPRVEEIPHMGPLYHGTLAAGDGDYTAHSGWGRYKDSGMISANSKVLAEGTLSDSTGGAITRVYNQLHSVIIKQTDSQVSVTLKDSTGASFEIAKIAAPARTGTYGPYTCSQHNAFFKDIYMRNPSALSAGFEVQDSTGAVVDTIPVGGTVNLIDKSTATGAAISGWQWTIVHTAPDGTVTTYGGDGFKDTGFDDHFNDFGAAAGTYEISLDLMNEYGESSERVTKTLTVQASSLAYDYNNGTGTYSDPTAYAPGTPVTLITPDAAHTVTGYTFAGWNTAADGSGTSYAGGSSMPISGAVTLYAQWTLRGDIDYKIEYYLEGAATPQDIDERHDGTAGQDPVIEEKSYAGYTYNPSKTTYSTADGKIAADGSLVVKVYYDPRNDCTYKVEHYKQKTFGTGYDLAETETVTGATFGASVTATAKTYAGFTINATTSETTGTVKADGSLTLKLYYDKSATTPYTVEHYAKDLSGGGYNTLIERESLTGVTGASVTAIAKTTGIFAGYTYNDTKSASTKSGVILSDGSLVLKLCYDRKIVKYTVNHYKDGTLAETETLYGLTGSTVTATVKPYDGYNFDSATSHISGEVAGDGSLVLDMFYNKDLSNTAYKVEYYQQKVVGNNVPSLTDYILMETEELTGAAGTTVSATVKSYAGFVENTTHADRVASGTITPDGSLVLKLYYDATKPAQDYDNTNDSDDDGDPSNDNDRGTVANDYNYKVEHYQQKVVNNSVLSTNNYKLVETENLLANTGTTVSATPKSYAGFTLSATHAQEDSGTVNAEGSLVLKLYYDAVQRTPDIDGGRTDEGSNYKVEHYLQTGAAYTLKDTEKLLANTGDVVTAKPKTYEGYKENTTHSDRVVSGTVNAAGSLVLKLYYDKPANGFTVEVRVQANKRQSNPSQYPLLSSGTYYSDQSTATAAISDILALNPSLSNMNIANHIFAGATVNTSTNTIIVAYKLK